MRQKVVVPLSEVTRTLLLLILGLTGLTLGGKWIVDGAVRLALNFGMSQALVGLTIVAVGTSLPELATSAMAAYRRNVEIAVAMWLVLTFSMSFSFSE